MSSKAIFTLFSKIETVLNTDPVPVAATDALEMHGEPKFEMVTAAKSRPLPLSVFGENAPLVVGEAYKLTGVKIPLKASGTAGTAPRIDPILRSAGFAKTTSAGVSVTYTPHSSYETETAAHYFWMNGKRHILLGSVCSSFKDSRQAGEIMYIEVDIIGMYGGTISDTAFPSPTFESSLLHKWELANFKINTGSEYTPTISKLDIDLGLETAKRTDSNAANGIARYYIKDRKTKYSIDPEQDTLANFNPYTLHTAQTSISLETKPTNTAGNIIETTCAAITLDAPFAGNRENIATWELSGQYRPSLSVGNTELIYVFK